MADRLKRTSCVCVCVCACVCVCIFIVHFRNLQSNIDSANTDGSFTMVNSNSFLSPYEILPIALKNKI